MNKIKILGMVLWLLSINKVLAQYKITGVVRSASDSSFMPLCTVSINESATITDSLGYYEFTGLDQGSYTLKAFDSNFFEFEEKISLYQDLKVDIFLRPDFHTISSVDLIQDLANGHLQAVENMGIYEGKKTELITVDKLVANLATNNARQVYARVPGLNIWENDGAGIQLSVGGRGLDPNRTSNFNVRQNGYDISADALGYPESYYTPPIEAIDKIQVVRGAASLQYGTQFGGLLNFMFKKPVPDKKIQLLARQSIGSFGFYNAFTSLSGTVKKLSYYTYFQYKRGNGWRPNSHFDNYNYFANLNYQISKKTKLGFDITLMDYLAQQPGGLSDAMFREDPRQSNRERNWFKVGWNMFALHFNHKFNASNEFNMKVFGLSAFRNSLGFRPNRVATIDDNSERDLIKGTFTNWGTEARYMKRYHIYKKPMVLLIGTRYYQGFNHSTQGLGSTGKGADFDYTPENIMTYEYRFPNNNVAFFTENIFYLSDKFSITPGLRYEYIHTTAKGYYGSISRDLAGNILEVKRFDEVRKSPRQFILGGIGLSYKPKYHFNAYGNISQNYRSITFSDMRIASPSSQIDPNMKDENGYSADLGIRSEHTKLYSYDVSLFYLSYNNRIGEILTTDERNRVIRLRSNVGKAAIHGVESYADIDLLKILMPKTKDWTALLFTNCAFIKSMYTSSKITGVQGNQVEFVPQYNLKSGIKLGYKKFKASFQYTYLSDQYSDATNAIDGGVSGVIGIIPSYHIMDLSLSYEYKMFKIEASANNLGNQMYYTRRATGYPGPGILPSDGRSLYLTLQVKL